MKSIFLGLYLIISASAFAAGDHPCAEDAKKLCSSNKGNREAMTKCMLDHQNDLSPACKEKLQAAKGKAKEKMMSIKENCMEDMKKFCSKETTGKEGKGKCLKSHVDQLSPKCKESFKH
jgi:hypothetical protein